jgi:hypothetical protein
MRLQLNIRQICWRVWVRIIRLACKLKYIYIAIAFVISNLIVFFIASHFVTKENHKSFNKIMELTQAEVALMHYQNYKDIAIKLNSGESDMGACLAGASATNTFNSLKSCIKSSYCRDYLSSKENGIPSELTDDSNLPFQLTEHCLKTAN